PCWLVVRDNQHCGCRDDGQVSSPRRAALVSRPLPRPAAASRSWVTWLTENRHTPGRLLAEGAVVAGVLIVAAHQMDNTWPAALFAGLLVACFWTLAMVAVVVVSPKVDLVTTDTD